MAALDERAEALGLKPGMGLADARAMHPFVEVVEAEPEADRRLLEALADWCDRYTPLVALDGADGLFLDISGCAHLFGGETAMLDGMLDRLAAQGFAVSGGLASTPGMAWAAARFGGAAVAPGGEAAALAPLPLAALRLEPELRAGFEAVGLRRAGAIMAAPRAPLARRFGPLPLLRLDQALGRCEEAISPRLAPPPLSAERRLAEPLTLVEDVERLAGRLALSLETDLERRGEGARLFVLSLFRVDGEVRRLRLRTARPLRAAAAVGRLWRERLAGLGETLDPGCGYDLVRLAAFAVAPLAESQGDLSGDWEGPEEAVAHLVDRIAARLGHAAVLAPAGAASHWPERAAALAPWPGAPSACPAGMERPLKLFERPEPVRAMAELPEGPPLHFRWRRALRRVARAEGPERIEGEWWRAAETAPARDYYRVEDAEGARYWLFREEDRDAGAPRWFIHGLFA